MRPEQVVEIVEVGLNRRQFCLAGLAVGIAKILSLASGQHGRLDPTTRLNATKQQALIHRNRIVVVKKTA